MISLQIGNFKRRRTNFHFLYIPCKNLSNNFPLVIRTSLSILQLANNERFEPILDHVLSPGGQDLAAKLSPFVSLLHDELENGSVFMGRPLPAEVILFLTAFCYGPSD